MASNSYIKYMVGVLGIENVSINLVVFLFVCFLFHLQKSERHKPSVKIIYMIESFKLVSLNPFCINVTNT